MTVEDRKNKMALPREQVAGVKYGNARVESKLDAIEKHLAKIEKVLSDIAARDEKKVKKKQKSS